MKFFFFNKYHQSPLYVFFSQFLFGDIKESSFDGYSRSHRPNTIAIFREVDRRSCLLEASYARSRNELRFASLSERSRGILNLR